MYGYVLIHGVGSVGYPHGEKNAIWILPNRIICICTINLKAKDKQQSFKKNIYLHELVAGKHVLNRTESTTDPGQDC